MGKKYVVVEGVESTWHYHISTADNVTRSFCGRRTMITGLPLSAWGTVSPHIGERYCKACHERYLREMGEKDDSQGQG